ncbi:MAG: choice-of-anchor D domain-containing protein [Nitrospiraceae bacterium]|nr:MAG: choice-of-anchor D domain-containing protein [Nitrospiraceae bacterium]
MSEIIKSIHETIKLLILLTVLLLSAFPGRAHAETIQYGYDDGLQVRNATYDDGTNIGFIYDTSGNRLSIDTALSGTVNNSPLQPVQVEPLDSSADIALNPQLSWMASADSDPGDVVTYDVYLGTTPNPKLIVSGYQSTAYSITLNPLTTYYWKIVARDNHNASAEGPVWSFTTTTDGDADGIADNLDNCQSVANPDQADMDSDGEGDACDSDKDGDTISNITDNCPSTPNTDQSDVDSDGYGDVCDYDKDGDGIAGSSDNCPDIANPDQSDIDGSGTGDLCEDDDDGDGFNDSLDNCLSIPNSSYAWYDIDNIYHSGGQPDYDLDGYGDICDPDLDNDGVNNLMDNCPLTPNGPDRGTCVDGNNAGSICVNAQECTGGYCSMDQEDTKGYGYGDACTYYHCVADSTGLQNVFSNVKTTPGNDVIRMQQGSYTLTSGLIFTDYDSAKAYSMAILGGFTAGCESRDIDPANTIIERPGQEVLRVNKSYNLDLPHWFVMDGITIRSSSQPMSISEQHADITIKNSVITDTPGYPSISLIVGNLDVSDNTFKNIQSTGRAGLSIDCYYCRADITENIFKNNSSSLSYSGLYVFSIDSEIYVVNNIISDNKSPSTYAYAGGDGKVRFINNTITGNNVGGPGNSIFLTTGPPSGEIELYNNIIWNNKSPEIYISSSSDIVGAYSNVLDLTKVYPPNSFREESFNINSDPLFNDAPGGDYHLTAGSPAVNKGRNSAPALPYRDFEGNKRIVNGIVDVGADEYAGIDITVLPLSLDFNVVNIGSYADQPVTVTNDGDRELDIYAIAAPSAPFSIITDNCSSRTLIPFASCTIDVRFTPSGNGFFTGSFDIPSNDPDETPFTVSLSGTGNALPIADPGGAYSNMEGQSFILDGSGSIDPDGTLSLYEWDIDDNAIYDYSSSLQTQSHTYVQQGTYTIRLRVTDNNGATDEATITAEVADTTPTADFTAAPTSGTAPLSVNFTNTSTGYDQPLTCEWDFDNDGVIDSTDQSPSYMYNNAGTYTVKLIATDSDNSANTLLRTNYITVTPSCLPPARIQGIPPIYFTTLQDAYNATVGGDIIQSQAVGFLEDLNVNGAKTVTFEGGYDCTYSVITGRTIINGNLMINNGKATIRDFSIEGSGGESSMSSPDSIQNDFFLLVPSVPFHPTSTPGFISE